MLKGGKTDFLVSLSKGHTRISENDFMGMEKWLSG